MPTPCWLKHVCSIRALVPVSFFPAFFLFFLSFSPSLFLANSLERLGGPLSSLSCPGFWDPLEKAPVPSAAQRAPGAYGQQCQPEEQGSTGFPRKPGAVSLFLSRALRTTRFRSTEGPAVGNQQGPPVQHGRPGSVPCGSQNGKGVRGEWIRVSVTGSPCSQPETITTLLMTVPSFSVTHSCLAPWEPWTIAHQAPLSSALSREEY